MQLLEFAAGWLGWSQQDALAADVNYVLAAYNGRVAMLQSLFGAPEAPKKPASAGKIKAFARAHNTLWKSGKMKKV